MTIISPTVGRRVWVFESAGHYAEYKAGEHTAQPYDGGVIFVHDDRCINVLATDHQGETRPLRGLPLYQEGDEEPNGAHARWMPYQTKQQAKADAAAATPVGTTATAEANTPAPSPEIAPNPELNNEGDPIGGDTRGQQATGEEKAEATKL